MSYSALIAFGEDGLARVDSEYGNGWGSAPVVWNAIERKYHRLFWPDDSILNPPLRGMREELEGLCTWASDHHDKMRWWEWVALQWTYDNALTAGCNLLSVAEALDRFEDAHHAGEGVCHLGKMAARMRALHAANARAVGLWSTSVSNDPWTEREEEDESPVPYNLLTGTRHWFIEVRR
jgi:hypothetical protein